MITSLGGGEPGKFKKRGGCMVQGKVFLKERVDTFPITFFQGVSFLNFAKFCYAFEEKLFFLYHHNFRKKDYSKRLF